MPPAWSNLYLDTDQQLMPSTSRRIDVREDVLVVRKSDDKLYYQLPIAHDNCTACPPIRMLPADAIVLLMDANYVRMNFSVAFGAYHDAT